MLVHRAAYGALGQPWLAAATGWCWSKLERADELDADGVKVARRIASVPWRTTTS